MCGCYRFIFIDEKNDTTEVVPLFVSVCLSLHCVFNITLCLFQIFYQLFLFQLNEMYRHFEDNKCVAYINITRAV